MLIYKITNTLNNKVYIGQTVRTLKERWSNYINEYKYSKRKNIRLIIRAMRKYGIDNFKIEIIKNNIQTIEELNEYEKYYIKLYKAIDKRFGYNVEYGGNGMGKHSPETCQKISNAQIGELNHMYGKTGADNHSSKPVIDITTGIRYVSATDAAKQLNFSKNNISKVCSCAKGIRNSALGHVFRYLDKNNQPIYVELPVTEKYVNYVYNETLKRYYNSLSDAAFLLQTSISNIMYAINNNIKCKKVYILKLGKKHKISYHKGSKVFDKVLEEYKYLVNTVPSIISDNNEGVTTIPEMEVDLR